MSDDKKSDQKIVISGTNNVNINRSNPMLTGIVTASILNILISLFTLFDESLQTVTAISNADSLIDQNNKTNNTLLSFPINTYTSVGPSSVNSYWIPTPRGIILIDT
ncbi:MAG: hypothetical protein WBN72_03010 [Nitrososphaeraceae archaeon]